jgi:hypothetical protein
MPVNECGHCFHRDDYLSPDELEAKKSDYSDSYGFDDKYYSREKTRGCAAIDTGMAKKLLSAGLQSGRRLFGGPGGKYILDEEVPKQSCLAKLFPGSGAPDKLDEDYKYRRVSSPSSPLASYDETAHTYSTASPRLPRAINMYHSESPRHYHKDESPRYYPSESPRYHHDRPMYCPECCHEKHRIHSSSPRGVRDFTESNWTMERYFH